MKSIRRPVVSLLAAIVLITGSSAALGAAEGPPDTLPNGLVRVKKSEAGLVYVRPDADLSGYTQFLLVEPTIAFRKHWKNDINAQRPTDRISDSDMAKMITEGKKLLIEQFGEVLTKAGYPSATGAGPNVLIVKADIVELDILAPDPNNTAGMWNRTYTDGAGSATLSLSLYDSVTGQLLVEAMDTQGGSNSSYAWRTQRTRTTNIADARMAFGAWAEMLVEGLKKAKVAKASAAK